MTRLGGYALDVAPEIDKAAADWPIRWVTRETDAVHEFTRLRGLPPVRQALLVCQLDGQAVACLSPDTAAGEYVVSDAIIRAGIVAHLRQCHEAAVIPAA